MNKDFEREKDSFLYDVVMVGLLSITVVGLGTGMDSKLQDAFKNCQSMIDINKYQNRPFLSENITIKEGIYEGRTCEEIFKLYNNKK